MSTRKWQTAGPHGVWDRQSSLYLTIHYVLCLVLCGTWWLDKKSLCWKGFMSSWLQNPFNPLLCGRHDLTHYFYSKSNPDGVFHHKVKLSFLQGVLISNVVLLILYQLFISYGYINNNVRRGDIRMALIAYIVVQNVFNLLTLYTGGRLCQLNMCWKITLVIISFLNNGLQRWIYYYREWFCAQKHNNLFSVCNS